MYFYNLVGNDGSESQLLLLAGTIPIVFQKATYNIPIDIFIPIQYPNRGPIVYVRPTQDMIVTPAHEHVESDGLVKAPALANWSPMASSLLKLIQELQRIFGAKPPLFSRPAISRGSVQIKVLNNNITTVTGYVVQDDAMNSSESVRSTYVTGNTQLPGIIKVIL